MLIATLIAAGRLSRDSIRDAEIALEDARLEPGGWSWVEEGSAADIEIGSGNAQPADVREALEGLIPGSDVIVQPDRHREKKLLVADMDSTIIGQECIDELADYAGRKPQVAAITERAMRGELDFAGALNERVALLAGLDTRVIGECLADRIRPNPGAETLVRTMRARGAETILVSGGFTAFVAPVAKSVGFEHFVANELSVRGGKLAGTVDGRIVDGRTKRDVLVEARERLRLDPAAVLAIGDGANDGLMIEEAGLGVAYRAKPALIERATARIDHNRLDALLWAQGIPSREWVVT